MTPHGGRIHESRLLDEPFSIKLPVVAGKLSGINRNGLRGATLLRAWRIERGLSQAEVAHKLGLKDPASIGVYEAGKYPLTLKRLIQLHELTGLPIWDLAWPDQRQIIRGLAGADPQQQRAAR